MAVRAIVVAAGAGSRLTGPSPGRDAGPGGAEVTVKAKRAVGLARREGVACWAVALLERA